MAYAKQANKHDEKQGDVGDGHRNKGDCVSFRVENQAGDSELIRRPCRALLRKNKVSGSKMIEMEMYHSLAQYLFPNQLCRFTLFELEWSRRDLPRMRDARLIPHMPNAIAITS